MISNQGVSISLVYLDRIFGKPNIILLNQIRNYDTLAKCYKYNKLKHISEIKNKNSIRHNVSFRSPVLDGMPILGLYDVNIYVDSKYIFSVTKQCEECSTKKKGARNIIFVFQPDF